MDTFLARKQQCFRRQPAILSSRSLPEFRSLSESLLLTPSFLHASVAYIVRETAGKSAYSLCARVETKGGKDATMSPSGNADFWKATLRQLKAKHRSQSGMLSKSQRRSLAAAQKTWEKKVLCPRLLDTPERRKVFENLSGIALSPMYTPRDIVSVDYTRDLGFPGEFPYTRGIYPTMYRGRIWTMRLFSGFGAPEDTNRRLRYLLEHGETGLSIAFDMPTLYGYDADHPRALGEVGKCGVSVSSLEDMEHLFAGIPVGKVSTSMTINAPAAVLTCMYVAVAEKQGVQSDQLKGTVQTDSLNEYIAQK